MNENKRPSIAGHPAVLSVYFVLVLGALLALVFEAWRGAPPAGLAIEKWRLLRMVVYCFAFGGIGGTTYSIYGLYKHTAKGDFDRNYIYWYVFRSLLGAVLGLVSYFLIQGGLFAFAQDASKDAFQAKAMLAGTAFLAGFSTNQFVDKLKELSKTLWGVGSHKDR